MREREGKESRRGKRGEEKMQEKKMQKRREKGGKKEGGEREEGGKTKKKVGEKKRLHQEWTYSATGLKSTFFTFLHFG